MQIKELWTGQGIKSGFRDNENRPHDPEPIEEPKQQTIVEKWKGWLNSLMKDVMDEYTASYYIISGHTQKHVAGSSRIWYERLKVITLPRIMVIRDRLS